MNLEVIAEAEPSPQPDPDFRPFSKSFRSIRSFMREWPSGNVSWYGTNSFDAKTAPQGISNQASMESVFDDDIPAVKPAKSMYARCSENCWCWK